ncbi:MAG: hypothetical protein HC927_02715 [Deltaproteobacteria bacterium]|nr:hypothetical protein [Deltaproteobacteria bacterium]
MGPVHAALVSLLRSKPEILTELVAGRSELRFAGPPQLLPAEVWNLIRPLPAPPGEFELPDELELPDDLGLLDKLELLLGFQRAPPEQEPDPDPDPDKKPTVREYKADLVIRVRTISERYPQLSMGAEVQTVPARAKITRWLEYGALYRLWLGPQFCLVFIATTRELAAWFRSDALPDLITERAFLFEPANFPDWFEHQPAEEPVRVLLAALLRGNEDESGLHVERGLDAISHLPESDRKLYYEALLSVVGKEKIMKVIEQRKPKGSSPYYSWEDYTPNEVELNSYLHVTGIERGLERGRRASLFDLLDARGLPLDAGTRERIEQCHDADQLARWHRRALTIETLDQLFESDE